MNQIDKLKVLAKEVLNDKDYELILKFIAKRDYDSFFEIVRSELVKEYRKCKPEEMTSRYCKLQDLTFQLQKYDISDMYMDACINYEEE